MREKERERGRPCIIKIMYQYRLNMICDYNEWYLFKIAIYEKKEENW